MQQSRSSVDGMLSLSQQLLLRLAKVSDVTLSATCLEVAYECMLCGKTIFVDTLTRTPAA